MFSYNNNNDDDDDDDDHLIYLIYRAHMTFEYVLVRFTLLKFLKRKISNIVNINVILKLQ